MSQDEAVTKAHSSSAIDASGRSRSPRRVRLAGYAVGVALTIGLAALAFWIVTTLQGQPPTIDATQLATPVVPAALQRPIVSEAGLADKSGVRIMQVAITGEGGLIDLRFQVIDPGKAGVIHNPTTPPTLVDDTTGVVVDNLFMGHSHTEGFTAGQGYYLIFENPGNLVQRGSTVSVLLGNAEVDHVPVQ